MRLAVSALSVILLIRLLVIAAAGPMHFGLPET
jgi:hypothetical protein